MLTRLRSLLVKEFIQFSRDRVLVILVLWLYTAEVIICAYALAFDVRHLPVGVVDLDQTPRSRQMIEQFHASEAFELRVHGESHGQAADWLQRGQAVLVLVIPERFGAELESGQAPSIQLLLDGTNSNTAALARGYALQILESYEQDVASSAVQALAVEPVLRMWYNPDGTYTSFMVLSMIALAALMVGVIHPAATIVREKEVGTLEQLRVTPIATAELFVAKTVPTLGLGLAAVFPSLLIAWWFGVPMRGSMGLFLGLTALFLLSAIGLGVLVAAVCRSMQQALLLSFFGLFPLMFLSGSLVPIESMPVFLQRLSLLSPLRYYMEVIVGIFLKGNGLVALWPQTLVLAGMGIGLFAAARLVFGRGRG